MGTDPPRTFSGLVYEYNRRMKGTNMKRILITICVACLSLVVAAPAFAYTERHAESEAETYAHNKWGGNAAVYANPACTGEFENVEGKTQWACYGKMKEGSENGKYFQVNIGPFGEDVFDRLCSSKCPGSP